MLSVPLDEQYPTERSRERQKDRTNDAEPRKRQHRVEGRFPLRRAQRQRGLTLFARA